jgi:hypothetical protein
MKPPLLNVLMVLVLHLKTNVLSPIKSAKKVNSLVPISLVLNNTKTVNSRMVVPSSNLTYVLMENVLMLLSMDLENLDVNLPLNVLNILLISVLMDNVKEMINYVTFKILALLNFPSDVLIFLVLKLKVNVLI